MNSIKLVEEEEEDNSLLEENMTNKQQSSNPTGSCHKLETRQQFCVCFYFYATNAAKPTNHKTKCTKFKEATAIMNKLVVILFILINQCKSTNANQQINTINTTLANSTGATRNNNNNNESPSSSLTNQQQQHYLNDIVVELDGRNNLDKLFSIGFDELIKAVYFDDDKETTEQNFFRRHLTIDDRRNHNHNSQSSQSEDLILIDDEENQRRSKRATDDESDVEIIGLKDLLANDVVVEGNTSNITSSIVPQQEPRAKRVHRDNSSNLMLLKNNDTAKQFPTNQKKQLIKSFLNPAAMINDTHMKIMAAEASNEWPKSVIGKYNNNNQYMPINDFHQGDYDHYRYPSSNNNLNTRRKIPYDNNNRKRRRRSGRKENQPAAIQSTGDTLSNQESYTSSSSSSSSSSPTTTPIDDETINNSLTTSSFNYEPPPPPPSTSQSPAINLDSNQLAGDQSAGDDAELLTDNELTTTNDAVEPNFINENMDLIENNYPRNNYPKVGKFSKSKKNKMMMMANLMMAGNNNDNNNNAEQSSSQNDNLNNYYSSKVPPPEQNPYKVNNNNNYLQENNLNDDDYLSSSPTYGGGATSSNNNLTSSNINHEQQLIVPQVGDAQVLDQSLSAGYSQNFNNNGSRNLITDNQLREVLNRMYLNDSTLASRTKQLKKAPSIRLINPSSSSYDLPQLNVINNDYRNQYQLNTGASKNSLINQQSSRSNAPYVAIDPTSASTNSNTFSGGINNNQQQQFKQFIVPTSMKGNNQIVVSPLASSPEQAINDFSNNFYNSPQQTNKKTFSLPVSQLNEKSQQYSYKIPSNSNDRFDTFNTRQTQKSLKGSSSNHHYQNLETNLFSSKPPRTMKQVATMPVVDFVDQYQLGSSSSSSLPGSQQNNQVLGLIKAAPPPSPPSLFWTSPATPNINNNNNNLYHHQTTYKPQRSSGGSYQQQQQALIGLSSNLQPYQQQLLSTAYHSPLPYSSTSSKYTRSSSLYNPSAYHHQHHRYMQPIVQHRIGKIHNSNSLATAASTNIGQQQAFNSLDEPSAQLSASAATSDPMWSDTQNQEDEYQQSPQTIQITAVPNGGFVGNGFGNGFGVGNGWNGWNGVGGPWNGRQVLLVNRQPQVGAEWRSWVLPVAAVLALPLILGALFVPVFLKSVMFLIQILQMLGLLMPPAQLAGHLASSSPSVAG